MEDAAVRETAAALGRIAAGAEPLEIGGVAAVHFDGEEAGRRNLQGVLGLALDGLGELFGCDLAEREVHACEVLAIERVEFSIVGRAVLRAEPPAPVAAFSSQERFVRFLQRAFGWGVAALLLAGFGGPRVGLARIPK